MAVKKKVTCTSPSGCVRGSVESLIPGLVQASVTWVQQHSVTVTGMHYSRNDVILIVLEDGHNNHS